MDFEMDDYQERYEDDDLYQYNQNEADDYRNEMDDAEDRYLDSQWEEQFEIDTYGSEGEY